MFKITQPVSTRERPHLVLSKSVSPACFGNLEWQASLTFPANSFAEDCLPNLGVSYVSWEKCVLNLAISAVNQENGSDRMYSFHLTTWLKTMLYFAFRDRFSEACFWKNFQVSSPSLPLSSPLSLPLLPHPHPTAHTLPSSYSFLKQVHIRQQCTLYNKVLVHIPRTHIFLLLTLRFPSFPDIFLLSCVD